MKLKRLICVFMSVIVFVSVFSACQSKYLKNYVYFDIKNLPHSLDPQIAESDEELLIVRNIFEGLLRKDKDGKIVCGAASDYAKDGLTYTFKLRENAVWSDGTLITADDFVFGLRRAVTPSVKAPFAKRLSCISGADSIINGTLSPENLGVKAIDGKTLSITLSREDSRFLNTLTTSVAMPCNEEFFSSTIGKYGLSAENIISNGSYVLKKWNKEDFGIRIFRNENYGGDFKANNGAVFISSKKDETPDVFFSKKSVDCAFVKSDNLDSVMELGANKISYQNICWVMTVGNSYSPTVRKALLSAFSPDVYKSSLPSGFTPAYSLYPDVLNVNGATDQKGFTPYNLEYAKSLFSDAVKQMEDKQFPSSSVYVGTQKPIIPAVQSILWHWQNNLCAFVNIANAKFPDELPSQLKTKDVPFAVFPVIAKSTDINEYLLNFGAANSSPETAQENLLKDNTLVPIAFEDTNICYLSELSNLFTECENGYIDFSFAIKKN